MAQSMITLNKLELLNACCDIAQQAGDAIMRIYVSNETPSFVTKPDNTPLTAADQTADAIICKNLAALTPELPILSEESADVSFSERVKWDYYWLVDPLDGTKEFLNKTGDFTVNIALIHRQHSILGVVFNPVSQELYFAAQGHGAYKQLLNTGQKAQPIHVRRIGPNDTLHLVSSRRHNHEAIEQLLRHLPSAQLIQRGSSLKFCLIAEGLADVYPRLGLTSEWDTAAAQCILEAAGGSIFDLHRVPLHYNTRDSLQNPQFLAVGDKSQDWLAKLNLLIKAF